MNKTELLKALARGATVERTGVTKKYNVNENGVYTQITPALFEKVSDKLEFVGSNFSVKTYRLAK